MRHPHYIGQQHTHAQITGEHDEHEDERGMAQEDERVGHSKIRGMAQDERGGAQQSEGWGTAR